MGVWSFLINKFILKLLYLYIKVTRNIIYYLRIFFWFQIILLFYFIYFSIIII